MNASDYEIHNHDLRDSQYRFKKKMRRLCDINTCEKISIVHKVLVGLMSQKMVAIEFNVKPAVVMSLVKKTK
jgi:hypothetical protein